MIEDRLLDDSKGLWEYIRQRLDLPPDVGVTLQRCQVQHLFRVQAPYGLTWTLR